MLVPIAFGFVDLCGFTALLDDRGEVAARAELGRLRRLVRDGAARRRVRVTKWLGDGVMLTGRQPGPVASLVLEVLYKIATDGSLAGRAGVAYGPALLFEGDDYVGRAANLAARICDQAGAGDVLAADADTWVLPPWIDRRPSMPTTVRGLTDSVRVARLVTASGDDLTEDQICGLRLPARSMVRVGEHHFCSDACAAEAAP